MRVRWKKFHALYNDEKPGCAPAFLRPLSCHFAATLGGFFLFTIKTERMVRKMYQNFQQFPSQMMQGGFFGAGAGQFTPAPMQRSQRGPDWLFVPFVKDAAGVAVPPGQTAWIMAQNEPAFAVRAADPTGVATTKFYRFEEFDPAAETAPASNFVTREEFDTVVKQFSAFLKEMGYESAV